LTSMSEWIEREKHEAETTLIRLENQPC